MPLCICVFVYFYDSQVAFYLLYYQTYEQCVVCKKGHFDDLRMVLTPPVKN